MQPESFCDRAMREISAAHDEGRSLPPEIARHIGECESCASFASRMGSLDTLLARGDFQSAPDIAPAVMERLSNRRRTWWSIAAIALIGITVGALVGGLGTRLDVTRAHDLGEAFHTAGSGLRGLDARMLIVERGVHPAVPERVYTGTINYVPPEQLAIRLIDTTGYPTPDWRANDVSITISNGDMVTRAGSSCPLAAMPDCLVGATTRAVQDLPPFDDGILRPLEIVGPGRSLAWPSAIDVLGTTELDETPAIQVRSTVAAVELIGAITDHGAWRELHPTDEVLMWLDEETLIPLRLEVFATDSPQRRLWQLRHDYEDNVGSDTPIFIIELAEVVTEPGDIDLTMPDDAPSRGFVEDEVEMANADVPTGFQPHRSGHWVFANGSRVALASWSDGRSWLRIEEVDDWNEPRLFGLSMPFVEPIDLGDGSIGYLSANGDALSIHGQSSEIHISGSVPIDTLIDTATSIEIRGLPVPSTWEEASTVDLAELPANTLVPEVEGWSVLGRVEGNGTTILLSGGGSRSVMITQTAGTRLDPPIGPDYSEVEVRGVDGRYNASETTLEWIEDGQLIRMSSETVALAEMVEIATTMVKH